MTALGSITTAQLLRHLIQLCSMAMANPTPGLEALMSYASRMGSQRDEVNAALNVEDFRALYHDPARLRDRLISAAVLLELEVAA
jgi:hypothetical protein